MTNREDELDRDEGSDLPFDMSAEHLKQLATTSSSVDVLMAVAEHPQTDSDVLRLLLANDAGDDDLWSVLAAHDLAPSDALAFLSNSPSVSVREKVAANTNAQPDLLRLLASDAEPSVVAAAADTLSRSNR